MLGFITWLLGSLTIPLLLLLRLAHLLHLSITSITSTSDRYIVVNLLRD